jgi:hypothetical protein
MSRALRASFWILVVCSVALVLSVTYLPMNDAPSHIANSVIALGLWRGDPYFAAHYLYSLTPVPYWATTLGMVPAMPVLGAMTSFKVLIALYVAALPVCFLYLLRTAAPDNAPLAAVAVMAAYHWAYWMGESNYLLGQPLIFLGYALFLRMRRVGDRAFLAFLGVAALAYLCHIYALTGLLIAVFSYLPLGLVLPRYRPSRAQLLAAGWGVALFLLAAYFVLVFHGDANRGALDFDLSLKRLVHMGVDPFDSPASPSRPLIFLSLALLAGALLGPYFAPSRQGEEEQRPLRRLGEGVQLPFLMPALGLLGAAYLGPVSILNPDGSIKETEIAIRFVLAGFLMALGAVRLRPGRLALSLCAAGVLLLVGLKGADAVRLHRVVDRTMKQVSAEVLARVPAQQRVLPLMDMAEERWMNYLFHRIGNYVVVERHGYSPHVFAALGQQTLRHARWGDQRSVADLQVRQEEWDYYDYVLVQSDREAPRVPGLAQRAERVARSHDFQLYRIKK